MTLNLLILCIAAGAVVAFSCSALIGTGLILFKRKLAALTPNAQARVLFLAGVLPLLTSLASMVAALAPSFGWIVDHCTDVSTRHTHPHLCITHPAYAAPTSVVLVFVIFLLMRCLSKILHFLYTTFTALCVRRHLMKTVWRRHRDGFQILPLDEPQAFILGVMSPIIFVTRGLMSAAHREFLAPVLAHEHAHIRRRDPLRRIVIDLALAFHLPGVATWLSHRLSRLHEMAADAEAADAIGSRTLVARALVHLTRAQKQRPNIAMAFGASNVEARVTMLLDSHPRHDGPKQYVLMMSILLLFVIVGLSAHNIHHGIEILLGLLSG